LEAEAHLRQGNPQEADAMLSPEPSADLPFEVLAHKQIVEAEVLCRLNRPHEADTAIHDAEMRIPSARPDLQAELAFTRGRCALTQNRADALQYYRAAGGLAHGGDGFIESSSVINIGLILLQDHRYVEAKQELTKGLSITDSPFLKEKMLGNLAFCYAEMGDWRQSISLAEQAEALAKQINNAGDQEKWLIDLGRAHLAIREFSKAEPYFMQALAIARDRKDPDGIARSLNDITQLALKRHDLETAERYWKEESNLRLGTEGKAYVAFDGAMIAMGRGDFPRAELSLGELLAGKTNGSLRLTAQRELGNVYWRETKLALADRTFRKAIEEAELAMSKLPPEQRMSFLDEDVFYDSYVRFLVAQGKSIEALRIAERGRAQILSQALSDPRVKQPTFELPPLQAVLRMRNQVALAYSLTDDESFLWVITPTQLKLFLLPSHRILGPKIDAYYHEIVDHPRPIEDSAGGQELYKALVQPAESLVPKGSHVVVVCSKILSLLNFESLVVPGAQPHYWIEDVEIETASSLALLARSKPGAAKTPRSKALLLLGAPIPASEKFPALPFAEEEMQRVRSHFAADQETVVSGKEAVPQAYRASNPQEYRLIHIDAHSVASDVNPLESFLVLSPTPNRSYELKADEIKDTRLQADLVTLSACYSAGTRWYQGEGIVGLGWAFLRAGAHQVVASLWAVDDASTPQLMDDFYGELTKGKSVAEALRTAKLNMLHSNSNHSRPFYWASLQLYTGS